MERDLFTPAPLPVAPLDDRGRLACLRLIRTEGVGPVSFRTLINTYGSAEAALVALPEIARQAARARPLRICPATQAEAEIAAAGKVGAVPVFTIEPGYPAALAAVDAPPPMLYVRGDLAALARPMVALVGSRECSAAGATMATRIAADLGAAGIVVASGLARGIDGAAHRSALPTGTVAVLAGGIDHVYPPENADLFEAIPAAGGAIVTEMAPGHTPRAADFPRRNRIISGISLGVVVVEAVRRSGGMITARFAGEQGREVFAVPGHPLDPRAEGPNHLIRHGATLITSASDILEAIGPITGRQPVVVATPAPPVRPAAAPLPRPSTPDDAGAVSTAADGDAVRAVVLSALGTAPIAVDVLVRTTALSTRDVQMALMELDLDGRLVRHPGQLVSRK
jgi:DNA processing protein